MGARTNLKKEKNEGKTTITSREKKVWGKEATHENRW